MTRDARIGLAIILVGAPASWWAVGFMLRQLDLVGRAAGWWP